MVCHPGCFPATRAACRTRGLSSASAAERRWSSQQRAPRCVCSWDAAVLRRHAKRDPLYPYTLHPMPYALCPIPYTPHPASYSKPKTVNPKAERCTIPRCITPSAFTTHARPPSHPDTHTVTHPSKLLLSCLPSRPRPEVCPAQGCTSGRALASLAAHLRAPLSPYSMPDAPPSSRLPRC